ncbi:MAG: lysophospholipid acyltransferase family protein [Myxococcota bacterium]
MPSLPSPGDLARWLFWVHLRDVVPVRRPAAIRAVARVAPLHARLAGARRALMADELRRCFGAEAADRVDDAYAAAVRAHAEELLVGRLSAETWPLWMRVEGRAHLDAALARGKGAIVLFPHAGAFMLMIASLSLAGYPWVQYAARGLAPEEVAREHPDAFGHNRWRKEARRAREASEDRLPARFLTMDTPLRALHRSLAANEVVGIAYDGRIGTRFVVTDYLGRRALLNPGPFRLAATTGAAIVPATCHGPGEGPATCTLAAPIAPDGLDAGALMARCLHDVFEPWLRAHPAEYGLWLLHCRLRPGVDDHPLFADYAPDERWRRHLR